jgi:hypothetical protein
VGIILAVGVIWMVFYLAAAGSSMSSFGSSYSDLYPEYISAKKSKGEVLLFQRSGRKPKKHHDAERDPTSNSGNDVSAIAQQTAIFQWEDVVYEHVATCTSLYTSNLICP